MILKRKAYQQLLDWKKKRGGATALLVEGQRRVGKSTLVEAFAKKEYDDYILIDFSEARYRNDEVFDLVSRSKERMNEFFNQLFLLADRSTPLPKNRGLIIFDEVQLYPKARQAIKFLVADGRYHYIETGSLITIKSNSKKILVPSEETSIKMYPLDFEEFLANKKETLLLDEIKRAYSDMMPLSEVAHQRAMKEFRTYMVVGGMPQAVVAHIKQEVFGTIDRIKMDILHLYRHDIEKEKQKDKITALFNSIPAQLSGHQTRFMMSRVKKGYRAGNSLTPLNYLDDSMIVNRCFDVNEPQYALPLSKNADQFRIYPSDIGLYLTQLFENDESGKNKLYQKVLLGNLSINEGTLMEVYVSQQLKAIGYPLYYHSFKYRERTKIYEVDFLINKSNRVCPIEVKSGNRFSHVSLDLFKEKHNKVVGQKYILSPKNLKQGGDILYLPLYMVFMIKN